MNLERYRRRSIGACLAAIGIVWMMLAVGAVHVLAAGTPAPDWDDPDYVKMMRRQAQEETAVTDDLDPSTVTRADRYTGKTYEHRDRLEGVRLIQGVDVSKWQAVINWEQVASDGIEFAFIRCGYSALSNGAHYTDPYFEANVAGARAAGLKVGTYYFSQARTKEEAESEAKYTLSILKGVKLDLPVMFDYESDKGYYNYGLTRTQGTLVCASFCDKIRSAGYDTGVYSGQNMMENGLYPAQLEEDNILWIARYNTYVYPPDYTGYIPSYTFWQYSDSGTVKGIGSSDMDYWYYEEKETEGGALPEPEEPAQTVYPTPVLSSVSSRLAGMKVTWKAVEGCSSYRVYRKTSGGSYQFLADTDVPEYTDGTAVSNTVYTYTVSCLNAFGEEAGAYRSKGISGRFLAPVTAKDISLSNRLAGMRISWKPIAGAVDYRIYRKESGGSYEQIGTTDSGDLTIWFDPDGVSGTKYTYAVRAVAKDAIGSYSGKSCMYLDPVVAGDMKVYNVLAGIRVTWKPIAGAEGYVICRKKGTGDYVVIDTVKGRDVNTYTDSRVESSVSYTYAVRACNGTTKGSYCGKKTLCLAPIRAAQMEIYNAPRGVTVKWPAVKGAKGYRIYRALPGKTYEVIADISGSEAGFWTDTSVVSGTTYVYCVRAVSGSTLGSYQGGRILALSAINGADLTISRVSTGVRIRWPKVTGAEGYRVYRKTAGGSYVRIKTISGAGTLSYTDTKAAAGETYTYCVRAVCGETLGGYSGASFTVR